MDTAKRKRNDQNNQAPRSGIGFIKAILDAVDAGPVIDVLGSRRKPGRQHGRNGVPEMALFRAYLLQFIVAERYANHYLCQLNSDPRLMALCGLEQPVTESTYSRFKTRLSRLTHTLTPILSKLVLAISRELDRLKHQGKIPQNAPRVGDHLAMDSTDIDAYAKRPRKKRSKPPPDPDAAWGYRTPKRAYRKKDKDERFYGYKDHEIVDAHYGLPLVGIIRPANDNDTTFVKHGIALLKHIHPQVKPQFFMADRGYDSLANFEHLVDQEITPIIAVRKPTAQDQLYDGIFNAKGYPTCIGQVAMEYAGFDPDLGHRFRCRPEGCHLKTTGSVLHKCDTDYWQKPEGPALRAMGIVPRFTPAWKQLYNKRTTVERYFRSAKHSRLLNRHQGMGITRVKLHTSMSRIAYLATMATRLKADDVAKMRHMSVRLAKSQPETPEQQISPAVLNIYLLQLMNQFLRYMVQLDPTAHQRTQ